jgi:ribosomal protein S18 acetylase RimI-like enzyme
VKLMSGEKMCTVMEGCVQDLDGLLALDELVFGREAEKERLEAAVRSGECIVARDGETVTGFALWDRSFFGQAFISLLIVHPDHRHRHVAKTLVGLDEAVCSVVKIFASARESNTAARRLLEGLGYVESGQIDNLHDGEHEIVYFKKLR